MRETYAAARVRLHREMGQNGWQTSLPTLKVLWAKDSDGHTVRFKSQAVYLNEHSLFLDIRGMSVSSFIATVNASIRGRYHK